MFSLVAQICLTFKFRKDIKEILKACEISFREALEIEDTNSNGHLTIDQFKGVLRQMGIKLTKKQVEYLIYEMYKKSKNSKKLKYNIIFEVLGLTEGEHKFSSKKIIKDEKEEENENEGEYENESDEQSPEKEYKITTNKKQTPGVHDSSSQIEDEHQRTSDAPLQESHKETTELTDQNIQGEGEDDDYINDEEML